MSAELPDTYGLGISGDSVFSCLVAFCAFFFSSENVSKIFFNLCKLSCRQYPHTMNSAVKPHIIQKANSFFLDLWAFYLMLLVSKLWFCRPLFHPSLILFFQVEDFWSIYRFSCPDAVSALSGVALLCILLWTLFFCMFVETSWKHTDVMRDCSLN